MSSKKKNKEDENFKNIPPKQKLEDVLSSLKQNLKDEKSALKKDYIPSIIEFAENPKYFNPPIELYPMQKLLLKAFYRGSKGNENLKLTKDDMEMIDKLSLNSNENGNLLDKWNNGIEFKELVLVWGRRCVSEDMEIVDPRSGRIWTFGELWNYGRKEIDSVTLDQKENIIKNIPDCNVISQGKREVFLLKTISRSRDRSYIKSSHVNARWMGSNKKS